MSHQNKFRDRDFYPDDFEPTVDSQVGPYRMRKRSIEQELLYNLRLSGKDRCQVCDHRFNNTNHQLMPNLCNNHQPHYENGRWDFSDTWLCCRPCFVKSLLTMDRFYDGSYECPDCLEPIKLEEIAQYVNERDFYKLDHKMFNYVLKNKGNYFNCPAPDCKFGLLVDKDCNDPELQAECPRHGRFCTGCRRSAHPGKTCHENHQELLATNDNENAFYQWTRRKIRKHYDNSDSRYQLIRECRFCQAVIMRNGGCSDMYCESCGNHFNWQASDQDEKFIQPLKDNERKAILQRMKKRRKISS